MMLAALIVRRGAPATCLERRNKANSRSFPRFPKPTHSGLLKRWMGFILRWFKSGTENVIPRLGRLRRPALHVERLDRDSVCGFVLNKTHNEPHTTQEHLRSSPDTSAD